MLLTLTSALTTALMGLIADDLHMKASDTTDLAVLSLLGKNPDSWHMFWEPGPGYLSADPAFAPETPFKVRLAKMRGLVKRGLVDGCTCGCRGDFTITPKGIARLAAL